MQIDYRIIYGRTPEALMEGVRSQLQKLVGWAVVGPPWWMFDDGRYFYYQAMVREDPLQEVIE